MGSRTQVYCVGDGEVGVTYAHNHSDPRSMLPLIQKAFRNVRDYAGKMSYEPLSLARGSKMVCWIIGTDPEAFYVENSPELHDDLDNVYIVRSHRNPVNRRIVSWSVEIYYDADLVKDQWGNVTDVVGRNKVRSTKNIDRYRVPKYVLTN